MTRLNEGMRVDHTYLTTNSVTVNKQTSEGDDLVLGKVNQTKQPSRHFLRRLYVSKQADHALASIFYKALERWPLQRAPHLAALAAAWKAGPQGSGRAGIYQGSYGLDR